MFFVCSSIQSLSLRVITNSFLTLSTISLMCSFDTFDNLIFGFLLAKRRAIENFINSLVNDKQWPEPNFIFFSTYFQHAVLILFIN